MIVREADEDRTCYVDAVYTQVVQGGECASGKSRGGLAPNVVTPACARGPFNMNCVLITN